MVSFCSCMQKSINEMHFSKVALRVRPTSIYVLCYKIIAAILAGFNSYCLPSKDKDSQGLKDVVISKEIGEIWLFSFGIEVTMTETVLVLLATCIGELAIQLEIKKLSYHNLTWFFTLFILVKKGWPQINSFSLVDKENTLQHCKKKSKS